MSRAMQCHAIAKITGCFEKKIEPTKKEVRDVAFVIDGKEDK